MAPVHPRLQPEAMALPLLQGVGEIRKADVLAVLRAIPEEEWTEKGGGHAISFGAFSRVVTSMRTASRRYPLTTRVLTRFMTSLRADLPFTTITVHNNVRHPPHTDGRNSAVPSFLVALTGEYSGGDLWLEDPRGDVLIQHRCRMTAGKCFDVRSSVAFSANQVLHAVMPWQGDRVSIVAYCIANPCVRVPYSLSVSIAGLGFRLPSPACVERFRYEVWGTHVYRQLRLCDLHERWPEGLLRRQQGQVIDLCSDGSGRELDDTVLVDSSSDSDVLSLRFGSAAPEPDFWDFEFAHEDAFLASVTESQLFSMA